MVRVGAERALFTIVILGGLLIWGMPLVAQDDADAERAQVIQRLIDEVFNRGRLEIIDEFLAEDFVAHPEGEGRAALVEQVESERAALENYRLVAYPVVVEGDLAVLRVLEEGIFAHPLVLEEELEIPPTGQPVAVEEAVVFRFGEDGQIVEGWEYYDNLAIGMQLGLIPATEGEGEGETAADESEAETAVEPVAEPVTSGMEETHKARVTELFEAVQGGRAAEAYEELAAEGFRHHSPAGALDVGAHVAELENLSRAFPEFTMTIDDLVAQGDWVAARYTFEGAFSGTLTMPDGTTIPGNGNPVELQGILFTRFDENGKIVEQLEFYDSLSYLQQLGLLETEEGIEES